MEKNNDTLMKAILSMKFAKGTDSKKEIQKLQQVTNKDFKTWQNTGQICKKDLVRDQENLHELTTDIVMCINGEYIEMLSNGYFLYRPSGKGHGTRSKSLDKVELKSYICQQQKN